VWLWGERGDAWLLGEGGLHRDEHLNHGIEGGGIDPRGQAANHRGAVAMDFMQLGVGRWAEVQPPDAAVLRVGAALHHAAGFQPVDQPRDGDRLDLEQFRQLLLGDAGLALQPEQDAPLRAGHAVRAGPLVGIDPEQPAQIVQQEQQVALEIGQTLPPGACAAHSARDHKQRYHNLARRRPKERCHAPAAEPI